MLPGVDGFELCRQVRRSPSLAQVPVLFLTARSDEVDRVLGLELGGDDYITKPFSPREVVARVRAVLRRAEGPPTYNGVLRADDLAIDLQRRTVRRGDTPIELTATEFDLLATLARQPGRPFTRAQLVDLVYGDDFDGYDRTVDAHIKNIRRKIEPDPREPRYIQMVYGVGYRFAEQPPAP
jgi:two-component system alkaline phosphatase synthesis response regulator PhoP